VAAQDILYKAEPADQRLVEPLDAMTLIYQRRSGITHMVAEPVPEMLEAMGDDVVDAATLVVRLAARFDLGDADDAEGVLAARLEELAELGLVERVSGGQVPGNA
jgi:PqqD family protein of HPr-rel-A system